MIAIRLNSLYHRGEECIGLYYAGNTATNNLVKKITAIKWSKTNKCWYMPMSQDAYRLVVQALKDTAVPDSTALETYLKKRKQVIAATPVSMVKLFI